MTKPKLTIEEFNALPRIEQRRAVALDAIDQLKAGTYIENDGYLSVVSEKTFEQLPDEINVRELILERGTRCKVCALGGLFASLIRLRNEVFVSKNEMDVAVIPGYRLLTEHLDNYFYPQELHNIEISYECPRWDNKFCKHPRGAKRMIAIMQSIADHPLTEFVYERPHTA
jgi:hypothetical protein